MGQAKLRGSKAERVAEGVTKRQEREDKLDEERADRWWRMTPKERETAVWIAGLTARFYRGRFL